MARQPEGEIATGAATVRVQGAEPVTFETAPEGEPHGGWFGRGWVRRYGGHPVEVRLDGRSERHCLFVGGRERTGHRWRWRRARPDVDIIFNVCDRPDLDEVRQPRDVHHPHLEGPFGYTPETLLLEAQEVIALLTQGERVLVHCIAGVNRAPTLCSAVLMVGEGLTARAALARVRRHRWMAFPDPWHWRALRVLEALLQAERENAARDMRSA